MGFNISGIVINKKFNSDSLKEVLNWNLKNSTEIDFESASSNWNNKNICNVYYSDKGTLIFGDFEKGSYVQKRLSNENSMAFFFLESSMTFMFDYCENGITKRSIMVDNGKLIEEEGEKLQIEQNSNDISETIWKLIEVILGKSFFSIENDEKAIAYSFVSNDEEKDYDFKTHISKEVFAEKYSDSDLLKYFDIAIKYAQDNHLNIFLGSVTGHIDENDWALYNEIYNRHNNLLKLVSEISNRKTMNTEISKRMDLEYFAMIGTKSSSIDKENNDIIMDYIYKIKIPTKTKNETVVKNSNRNFVEKKNWWEFWK
ncbi:hypothetical protein [Winogradskyella psychrotolerans]|uniref:hypothetical protein n=1 Tax=Winogradskyella psychrotolerans TaxID=1344585 RepID=UPI001C077585|nr:hypothetical protein [Winogradskyella psychrotolerans]MBU2928204.1 hypothetical protein [Winogradskyella psychrotolerans]